MQRRTVLAVLAVALSTAVQAAIITSSATCGGITTNATVSAECKGSDYDAKAGLETGVSSIYSITAFANADPRTYIPGMPVPSNNASARATLDADFSVTAILNSVAPGFPTPTSILFVPCIAGNAASTPGDLISTSSATASFGAATLNVANGGTVDPCRGIGSAGAIRLSFNTPTTLHLLLTASAGGQSDPSHGAGGSSFAKFDGWKVLNPATQDTFQASQASISVTVTEATPEPASGALLALGASVLVLWRRARVRR